MKDGRGRKERGRGGEEGRREGRKERRGRKEGRKENILVQQYNISKVQRLVRSISYLLC